MFGGRFGWKRKCWLLPSTAEQRRNGRVITGDLAVMHIARCGKAV
jgi:hypothetical protein